MIRRMLPVLGWLLGFALTPLAAVELWRSQPTAEATDPSVRLTLNPTLKLSALGARNPDDRLLFPQADTALLHSRLRLHFALRLGAQANVEIDYEQQGRYASYDLNGGNGFAAALGGARLQRHPPYRVTPLYDRIVDERRVQYDHELDRLSIALHPGWGEVIVGRQAVGLGRGVLFTAVGVFAPFAPLEVDREWQRGVDAARIEVRLTDKASAELIAIGGESWAESAALARLRGYLGEYDAELIAGVRSEDLLLGGVLSGNVGDAELHTELLLFRTLHPQFDPQPTGDDRLAPKFLLGGSYAFVDIGDGLNVAAEYFFSGFGAADPRDIDRLLLRPEARLRYLRGDTQILGQHALGLQATLSFWGDWTAGANLVASLVDGSGALSPSLRWNVNDTLTALAAVTVPWGRGSRFGNLRSEYGAQPTTVFVQVAGYL